MRNIGDVWRNGDLGRTRRRGVLAKRIPGVGLRTSLWQSGAGDTCVGVLLGMKSTWCLTCEGTSEPRPATDLSMSPPGHEGTERMWPRGQQGWGRGKKV